jgi:hypothetical protein
MKQLKETMRKFSIILVLLFTTLTLGCKKYDDKPDEMFGVKFNINAMSIDKPQKHTKSLMSSTQFLEFMSVNPEDVTNVRIGIDGSHDVPVISEILPFNLSDGITGVIKLNVGDHELVSMELLKDNGDETYEVLYSAVSEGSPLSQFVSTTVPITFNIPLMSEVPINVDVVAIDDWTPEDFG